MTTSQSPYTSRSADPTRHTTACWQGPAGAWTYERAGSGRQAVVLLHGMMFDRHTWRPVLDELARDHTVIAPDLPGHGDSPARDGYRFEDLADDLAALLASLDLVSPIIVGHSMAAYLATVYATRHPVTATVNVDQPLRLTDLAPLVRQIVDGDQQTFDHAAERLIASMRLETMPGFHDAVRPRPNRTVFLGYCQELGARTPAELDSWLTNTAAAVTGPYLSILSREPWPGYDGWLRDLLPTSTCHVYQQEGHFPHLSDPTRFVQDLYALSGRSG